MKEKDDGWIAFFKANPSFAPILFFLFILALVTAPIHPQVCAESEEYPCKYVIRENLLTGFFYYANAYSGAIIAFFTATLWGSAIWQGRLTRDSINLAREEFVATHRPMIAIKGLFLSAAVGEERAPISFMLYNVGSSEAKIVGIIFYFVCRSPSNVTWPDVKLSAPDLPAFINAGYNRLFFASADKELNDFLFDDSHTIEGYDSGELAIEIRVRVAYEDAMGGRRETSIARAYDMRNLKFRPIADSEFEYQT